MQHMMRSPVSNPLISPTTAEADCQSERTREVEKYKLYSPRTTRYSHFGMTILLTQIIVLHKLYTLLSNALQISFNLIGFLDLYKRLRSRVKRSVPNRGEKDICWSQTTRRYSTKEKKRCVTHVVCLMLRRMIHRSRY
jgi:hypothetical protein